MDNRPIGIFDSGSGGLSIWKAITTKLPHESILYTADHRNIPYSTKSAEIIRKRVVEFIRFFLAKQVKLIVIACNTATVAGIDFFRETFPGIPIVGVVPVIKTAAEKSKTKNFAVLSTEFTAKSVYQKKLISSFASDCTVLSIGNTALVEFVESGKKDSKEVYDVLEKLLRLLLKKNIDTLVLGCTHFPFLRPVIQDIVGPDVVILDSGEAVARRVQRILEHEKLLANNMKPSYQFFTTGDTQKVSAVVSDLLKMPIVVTKVPDFDTIEPWTD
jgi:glutamate racemase